MDRDVVLVTVDALRADHVGLYDDEAPPTPAIDAAFAPDDTLVCGRAFAAGPYTRGAFPAIMTGCHAYGDRPDAFSDRPNLAAGFRDVGYATAGIHSNPHLATGSNFERGYDTFEDGMDDGGVLDRARDALARLRGTYEPYRPARETTDLAVEWLETTDCPRFLWVHYMDPHAPYRPRDRTESAEIGARTSERLWSKLRTNDASEFTADELATLRTLYRGEITHTDREIGRLLDAINRTCTEPIVALVGDHGDLFGEDGYVGHPNVLHDGLLHVPFVIRGLDTRGWCETPVSGVDILPTLHDAVDIPLHDACQGAPVQSLPPANERIVFAQGGIPGTNLTLAATDGQLLFTRAVDEGTERLYDRTNGHDRPGTETPERLRAALEEHLSTIDRSDGQDGDRDVSDEVERRLADLGYT